MSQRMIPLIDHLEIIEGMLKLSETREAHIQALMEDVDTLSRQLSAASFSSRRSYNRHPARNAEISILIGDASVIMRQNLLRLFRDEGFNVIGNTGSGPDLIKQFKNLKPAIVTVDTKLEKACGFDVARELRTFDTNARIIVTSNSKNRFELIKAVQSGASDYITKPVHPDRLLRVVNVLLDK